MRARSWAPCTTKRPAATGARPARLSRTQSCAATRAKFSASGRRVRPAAARDQRAHRLAVGRRAEIDRDLPAPAAGVEQAHGDIVSGEVFGEEIGQPARRLFIGFQAGNRGREWVGGWA